MNDSRLDQMCTLEVVRQLDACFRRDSERGLASARAMSRGSAIFLAHHLGPAPAYDIASKSADDIITEAASELAVPVEAAPDRQPIEYVPMIAFGLIVLGSVMTGIGLTSLLR